MIRRIPSVAIAGLLLIAACPSNESEPQPAKHVLSGTVTRALGGALAGVSVALGGAATGTAMTDVNGRYAFPGVSDGSYTVTPALAGWVFTPASAAVRVAGGDQARDFTAFAARSLGGTVRDGIGNALSGMTVRLTGERAAIATTAADGTYAFTGLADGQGYTVTPATFGYSFKTADGALGPDSRSYTVTADVVDADFGGTRRGPTANEYRGTLTYAGTRRGPVYVTILGQGGGEDPVAGTGLATAQGPWSGRAFTIRNAQAGGPITVRAWMDTLGIGRFNAGADPSVTTPVFASGSPYDLGALALQDPPAPTVASSVRLGAVFAGDRCAAVIYDAPRNADGEPVADGYRVYWNTSATVDSAHTLGTLTVPAGPDFALVHGLTNGTGYWFRVEAWLGGAPMAGQGAVTTSASTPAASTGSSTVTGKITHPTVAAPSALYVVAQAGKGGPGSVWIQRVAVDPPGTETDYSLTVSPGTYQLFAFVDVGDDGALGVGEPALFPGQGVPVVTLVAGANAGPTVAIPSGSAAPRLTTSRWAGAFGSFVNLVPGIESGGKVPLSAALTGPGLRGPLDLGLRANGGGTGVALGAYWGTEPIEPFVGDAYSMAVSYTDGTVETFTVPVSGLFEAPPGVVAPSEGATNVGVVPTFAWTAPPGSTVVRDYTLQLSPQAGGDDIWEIFLPGTQTSVLYDADGMARSRSLSPFTDYGWNIRATDAFGNDATYRAGFTTGADVLPLYDALAGPTLDGALWQTPLLGRSIASGVAVLSVQADDMQARTVQGATYTNAVNVLASGQRITTLGATVSLPAASAARTGAAVLLGGIRMIYQPSANRGALFPAGNMNILAAVLELFDDGSGLRLRRRFYHCDDPACVSYGATGIAVVDPLGFTASGVDATSPAAWDTPYALELSLDEATGTFTWRVQGGAWVSPVSGTADPSTWATGVGMALDTASDGFLNAQLFTRVSDESGGGSARVATLYDDARVAFNGATVGVFDDFSSGAFSPLKWGPVDSDVWMGGGRLHLASAITTAVDGTASEGTTVNAMFPATFSSWQADVAIVGDSQAGAMGSSDVAGILGSFYNDGTAGTGALGDVRARVNLGVEQASFSIFRCTTPTCGPTTLVASGGLTPSPLHPLGLGTVHALSIRWDAAARLFTFGLDDAAPVQIDPTSVMGSPAPVGSPTPRYPAYALTTNVFVGAGATAGTTASMEATFANVRGAPP